MSEDIKIEGAKEMDDFMRTLTTKLGNSILRSSLRAGAKVYAEALKPVIPVAPPNLVNAQKYGYYEGSLRDSMKIKTAIKDGKARASVRLGGKLAYYAAMVEYGTKAHLIAATKGKVLSFSGRAYASVNNPGATPRRFARPVFDSQGQAAIEAVRSTMAAKLTLQGLETQESDTDEKA